MFSKLVSGVALASVICAANAGGTISVYEQFKDRKEMDLYILGLYDGIGMTNQILEHEERGKIRTICIPKGLKIDTKGLRNIMDAGISISRAVDKDKDWQITNAFAAGMMGMYPCAAKQD